MGICTVCTALSMKRLFFLLSVCSFTNNIAKCEVNNNNNRADNNILVASPTEEGYKNTSLDYSKLNENVEMGSASWTVEVLDGLDLEIAEIGNDSLKLKLKSVENNANINNNNNNNNSEMERKMKMTMKNMIPYMIVPGFIMAGIMPWIMPGIKMMVSTVSMINQMAFTASLFALIRSYVFDTEKAEHIVYVNHGYRPKPNPHIRYQR